MKIRQTLGNKNLFYSMILAGIMLLFLVGYFGYMLPSLYVDYQMEQNLKSVREQHQSYVRDGNYDSVQVKNPTACFSVKIPDTEDSIYLNAKFFSIKVSVVDEQLKELFTELRRVLKAYYEGSADTGTVRELFAEKQEEWESVFQKLSVENIPSPIQVQVLEQQDADTVYSGEYWKVHPVSDKYAVFEMGVRDENNQYINYIAAQKTDGSLILTFLPVVTPDMNEIRPIVFQSLPMLAAVIFLLVLLFSQVYSRGIVSPVVRLVQHTQQMKNSRHFQVIPMDRKLTMRKDEIGILAAAIESLYHTVQAGYEALEEKNQALAEENKRQEVLLKASSHQLKTPISAALLLVDGMANKVGKYQDTQTYLPRVKEQLLSMKKMVEDILYLNHCGETLYPQKLEVRTVLENQLSAYRVAIADRQLQLSVTENDTVVIETDETLLAHILENILSNVVSYTPCGGLVEIVLTPDKIQIENFGVQVEEDILPHIFEPFVSGSHHKADSGAACHGLGMYIAAYYARKIGMKITISNGSNCVMTVLYFNQ